MVNLRCTNTEDLEVHHINRGGGNGLANAQVLCSFCHQKTPSYGESTDNPPPEFSDDTKTKALERAGYQCECIRDGCPHPTT